MELYNEHAYNGEMLRMAIALRGLTSSEVAAAISVKPKDVRQYCSGAEPPSDVMNAIAELLRLPLKFFYRPGEFPERDPRYPPDMYVPLKKPSGIPREELAELLNLVPDEALPELRAYMHELAAYASNVSRLPTEE